MSKLTKVKGAKAKCNTCGDEMICVEIPAKGNFAARLQWQNPEGGAHYNTVDGVNFTCNRKIKDNLVPNSDTIPNMKLGEKFTGVYFPKEVSKVSIEDRLIEAKGIIELAWQAAATKAWEIYGSPSHDSENSELRRNTMILSQVIFKAYIELMR